MNQNHLSTSEEVWKDIPEYPAYQVSNHGRVRSFITRIDHAWVIGEHPRRILRPIRINKNYFHVRLQSTWFQVHVLVLMAFVGPCPSGHECCHNDGNGFNNHISNLRWDTRLNNAKDKEKHGTKIMGSKNHKAKLLEFHVKEIRRLYAAGMTEASLSRLLPINQTATRAIVERRSWKHI